jgi:hypothetical protein
VKLNGLATCALAAAVLGPMAALAVQAGPASASTISVASCCHGGGTGHTSTVHVSTGHKTTVGQHKTTNRTSSGLHGGTSSRTTSLKAVNTGSLVTSGRTTYVSTRAISVSRSTRVSGSRYSVDGATYTYESASYWHSVSRPAYGTRAYWTVYNDPFYYPNYLLPGNPWYGHAYPVGYYVSDGYFMPVSSGASAGLIVGVVIGVLVLVAIAWLVLRLRRRSGRPQPFGASY